MEIQPLKEPFVCPLCGCKDIEEVINGVIIATAFRWDEKQGRYKQYDEDTDGLGERWLQCAECRYDYSEKELEKFDRSNPELA